MVGGTAMNENWRSEWSRHFDQIQWVAITILTTGAGGLLAYSLGSNEFQPSIGFLGLWISALSIYYTASFREFRKQLHDAMPDNEERQFLENRKRCFRQWPAFMLT